MKLTRLIIILLLIMNLGGHVVAQGHAKQEPEIASESKVDHCKEGNLDETKLSEYKVRIAFIGNSITKGSHLKNPAEDSYPSQLKEMLSSVFGDNFIVNNYGLSGRTMLRNGPSPIWNEPEFSQAVNWKPDICFILLGTNDSRPSLWKRSGKEFLGDYLAMIDTFKTRNPDIRFIVGVPTPIWEGHSYGGDTWGEKHNDSILVNGVIPVINKIAESTDALLIDFHTAFKDSNHLFPDLLHPNRTGANHMARMIFELIQEKNMIYEVQKSKKGQ